MASALLPTVNFATCVSPAATRAVCNPRLHRNKNFAPYLKSARLATSSSSLQAASVCTRSVAGERTAAASAVQPTEWLQKVIELPPYDRGCHLITRNIYNALPELSEFEVGMANLFIMHTSAALTINENASPDVPLDLSDSLDRIVPERAPYRHTDEGPDDMPAHVKSTITGASLSVPISHGRFGLGTWQGLCLMEFRNYGGPRRIMITIQGQKRADGRKYPNSSWR